METVGLLPVDVRRGGPLIWVTTTPSYLGAELCYVTATPRPDVQ